MTFEPGEVVQIVNPDTNKGKPNPFLTMVGVVLSHHEPSGNYLVFFDFGPLNIDKRSGLRGFRMAFAPAELAKIGVLAQALDYGKIDADWNAFTEQTRKAHPEVAAMFDKLEEGKKWRHLEPGSVEAKMKGCECVDIRAPECIIHGHTIAEMHEAALKVNDAFDKTDR